MNKLMIGIPIYNDKESFIQMLKSLRQSTDAYDLIYIVESESTDGVSDICDKEALFDNRIEVIHTKKEGPLKAYNLLFNEAKKRQMDLFLTQTDVYFPKLYKRDWLNEMKEIAQLNEVGAVTCLNGGGISGDTYLNGFKWFGGWCLYIPIKVINELGGFDENYLIGDGVDIDYSYAINQKWKLVQINYWVDHHTQFLNERQHENIEEIKKKNSEYFKRKWGIK